LQKTRRITESHITLDVAWSFQETCYQIAHSITTFSSFLYYSTKASKHKHRKNLKLLLKINFYEKLAAPQKAHTGVPKLPMLRQTVLKRGQKNAKPIV